MKTPGDLDDPELVIDLKDVKDDQPGKVFPVNLRSLVGPAWQLSRLSSTPSTRFSRPARVFLSIALRFNHLLDLGIWHHPCLAKGVMARKFQMEILDMAQKQSLSPPPQTARVVPFFDLRRSLSSRVAAITPLVDQLMRFILSFRKADGSELEIEVALREALANAIIHGNGENPRKRVYVACRCYVDGEVLITVRDGGRGFDSNRVPDPTTAANQLLTHGRGIYLMKTLMDELWFENGGSVLCMRKKSNSASTAQRRTN